MKKDFVPNQMPLPGQEGINSTIANTGTRQDFMALPD